MEARTKEELARLSLELEREGALSGVVAEPELEGLLRELLVRAVGLLAEQERLPNELAVFTTAKAMTTGEAAAALGVSIPTVRKLVARGDLQAHYVGTHLRVHPDAVASYLDARRTSERDMDALVALSDELRDLGLE
jgi:excisionase family DNA binding protein